MTGSTIATAELSGRLLDSLPQKDEWVQIPGAGFLEVFDVPWAEGEHQSLLIDTEDPEKSVGQPITALQALPTHGHKSFRFYVAEDVACMEEFWHQLAQASSGVTLENRVIDLASSSFVRLRSQWNSQSSSLAWLARSYSMLAIRADRRSNQRSDRGSQDPSCIFSSSLMRFSKTVRVIKADHGRVSGTCCCVERLGSLSLIVLSLHCKCIRDGRS